MNKFFTLAAVIFAASLILSCSPKMNFAVSPVVPAATGTVKIKKDNNGNYIITVNVINLANSRNLTPSRDVYVVWVEGDGPMAKNIGQIKPSSGLFSKAQKASMKGSASVKPTRIFITAENDAQVRYPDRRIVLTTK